MAVRHFVATLVRFSLLLPLFSLMACGGGGGGAVRADPPPAAPPPTPPPTPPVVEAPNPAYSQHLEWTNTYAAHDAGFTGAGVRIGIVDSGVNRDHPALSDRVVANLTYINGQDNDLSVDDVVEHGTAVAQAAAGSAFGQWPGGIAPGAEIVSARIISDDPPEDDGSGEGNEVDGALGLAPIHQDLIDRGVRIMNNSWGGLYWTNPAATAPIAAEYRPFIVGNDGLVVFAAGNESRADPSDMAALPSQPGTGGTRPAADLERGWLTVVALDADSPNALASYSNACGIAMHYCLAAPGTVVVTGTDDPPTAPEYWRWSGTSLAAPLVSGAAALVWEAFPYFDNDLVRQTLLGTATDLGDPGVDAVFGYGSLDVGRAVNGPGRFDWGDVTADFDAITSTWGNDITGDGGLIKRGSGILVLSGSSDYLGDTQVLDGTLQLSGALQNSSIRIGAAGTLSGDGSTGGDVDNQGTLALDGGGPMRIGGDYLQGADARLALLLPNSLQIDGAATLQGGDLQVLGVVDGYVATAREEVLVAQGGLTGRFDSVGAATGVFLEATAGYDASSAWLDISRLDVSATAKAMKGISRASQSAADRIEAAFDRVDAAEQGGEVADAGFLEMAGRFQTASNEVEALASLRSLSGELHAAADAAGVEALEARRRALSARLDALAGQPLLQGAWYRDLGGPGQGVAGFQMNGWVLGQDQRLGEGFVVGLAFGENRLDGYRNDSAGRSRDRQTQAEMYLGKVFGRMQVLGQLSLGRYERQLRRELMLGDEREGVASEYAGDFVRADLEFGYRFGDGASHVVPYLGAGYLEMGRGGFAESDAGGFGLRANADTLESVRAVAGLRARRDWGQVGGRGLSLRGYAEWLQSFGDDPVQRQASFTGVEAWSPLQGDQALYGGRVGLGLDAWLTPASSLSFGYDQRFGGGDAVRGVSLRYRHGF
ncbi:autotransporter domain-containing protein [Pseudoxanthomonas kalamensis DSM 18571]|uniref:S8 family serine peptidase n=1 Tax=Pseudoxanthomonas kalamensis TaxID=289483 RepID=UPI0013914E2D|nr:S8 family serine peptidase [Pseudoxanthomonas kalamensis]KAF1708526.1 autotransporter domain-containing protein [Pseudoxanthomonas kalamensis DSM 18571]